MDITDGMENDEWVAYQKDVIAKAKAAGVTVDQSGEFEVPVMQGGKQVATVDITPHIGEMFGYVFAMEGKEPVYEAHSGPERVWSAAAYYYGVSD